MYLLIILLMMIAIKEAFSKKNKFLHRLVYINILQSSIILFYIYTGSVFTLKLEQINLLKSNIINFNLINYSNPLTNVLMLTAIVVGFAICALGFALILKLFYKK